MVILFSAILRASPCELRWIPVEGVSTGLTVADRLIPTHTVLRSAQSKCGSGFDSFEVVHVPRYAKALSVFVHEVGSHVCLGTQLEGPDVNHVFYSHVDSPALGLLSGEFKAFAPEVFCGTSPGSLSGVSLVARKNQAAVLELQEHWVTLFGPQLRGRVEINPWGYVALPHEKILDPVEIALSDSEEHLFTKKQKEKGIRATGPTNSWMHFWGADPPESDHWAPIESIKKWVDLAHDWTRHCQALELGSQTQCSLKIGDLAWLNGKLPDPLGHKTHYRGTCMDIRLFRDDQSTYEAYWNREDDRPEATGGYSADLTQAFVDFVHGHSTVDVFYFNDPDVRGVSYSRGHDDHLHLCLK